MVKKAITKKEPKKKAAKSVKTEKSAKKTGKAESKASGPGKKYTCHSCGIKFYDLNKPDKICPKCGADQLAKPSRQKAVKSSEYDISEEEETETEDFRDDEAEFVIEDDESI